MVEKNNEIDLIEVFNKLLSKIRKYKILFFTVIFVFLVLGIVFNLIKKETYTFSSIATSPIDKQILLKSIEDINIKNDKTNFIPRLKKITLHFNDINETDYDSHFFDIKLILKDTVNVKTTINQLKKSLSNIDYINKILNTKKDIISAQIENYTSEVKKINSIQNLIFNNNDSKSTIISTNGLSESKINFKNMILKLKNEYNQIVSINIINKDSSLEKNSNIIIDIIKFLILGISIAFIVILIKK